eukprot:172496-Pelagomonas_calceolata.AAC.1
MASGINTALANAQGLQTRLFQKFGELKRPVISKAKSAQEVEDEERGLKSMQLLLLTGSDSRQTSPNCVCREKLNTLEKKLRIFRDLDTGKADERVRRGREEGVSALLLLCLTRLSIHAASLSPPQANVMTSLDGARRELLAAAREFEAYSFGSKVSALPDRQNLTT